VKSLANEAHHKSGANDFGSGIAVLYTEHNMDAVFGVADRVLVLIEGQLVAQGSANDVAQNELVRTRYLGRSGHAALSGHSAGALR
jgi:branched-chain amino acid transport system ATP-binding protein